MSTAADILVKFVEMLIGRHDLDRIRGRDQRDRVAGYLERVATCLCEAADALGRGEDAWEEIGEVELYLRNFREVLKPVGDDDWTRALYVRLEGSYENDCFVSALSHPEYLPGDQESHQAESRTPAEQALAISSEIAKIRRASGHFKAAATELRATSM